LHTLSLSSRTSTPPQSRGAKPQLGPETRNPFVTSPRQRCSDDGFCPNTPETRPMNRLPTDSLAAAANNLAEPSEARSSAPDTRISDAYRCKVRMGTDRSDPAYCNREY